MSASPVTLAGKNKRQLYPLKVLMRHPKILQANFKTRISLYQKRESFPSWRAQGIKTFLR